jgi:hypothetical protein
MKKRISLFIAVWCFLISGCAEDFTAKDASTPSVSETAAGIVVRASNEEPNTRSTIRSTVDEPVVFTGNDILWFNETMKELRFNDNFSKKDVFSGFRSFKFYMDGEYLFSSMIYVTGLSSQVFNSLVFYYNITENKYFLHDGYPVIDGKITIVDIIDGESVIVNEMYQQIRNENMQKIESEWNIFIAQLKKDGRLQN